MAQKPDETLLRADTFTNVPKVSRRTLTKEEREELAKQQAAETKEAEKLAKTASKGAIGRWWRRLQSGPNKISLGMAIVALGVVYGDIFMRVLYATRPYRNIAPVHRADVPFRPGRHRQHRP